MIVYGSAEGTPSQGAALTTMLKTIHNMSGDKPQIGKVFRFNGTNMVGLFFTVTDHPDGNLPLAGMVIAKANGANSVQVAMLYDRATNIGQTVNPMLQQLFSLWNPAGSSTSSASRGSSIALPPMRQYALADGTAAVSLPAGWNIIPNQSALGQTTVAGPQGELIGLNNYYNAEDPYNPQVQNGLRRGIRFKQMLVYPANIDMTKNFADIFQRIRASLGQGPAPMKVDSVTPIAGSQGQCVFATGQLNPDGSAMRQMDLIMCRATPQQNGFYQYLITKSLLPLGDGKQQRAIAFAIIASYKTDMQRAEAIAGAEAAPMLDFMRKTYEAHQDALMNFTQSQIANIHQIGENATELYETTGEATARNVQGFTNYLLDQTVVQNNYTGAHSTQWNSVANALVNINPNKYSFVSQSNYIPGPDF